MRIIWSGAICLLVGITTSAARADPYPWCAIYNMGDAAYSCYFLNYEQCQASVSGMGGICQRNHFYDGRPEGSQGAPVSPPRPGGPNVGR